MAYLNPRTGELENDFKLSPAPNAEPIFEYEGGMYMRPVDRGAVLSDLPDAPQFDNDVLPAGDYYVEIRVFPAGERVSRKGEES